MSGPSSSSSRPSVAPSTDPSASNQDVTVVVQYEQRNGYSEDQVFNNPIIEEFVRVKRNERTEVWRPLSLTFARLPFKSSLLLSPRRLDAALKDLIGDEEAQKKHATVIVCTYLSVRQCVLIVW